MSVIPSSLLYLILAISGGLTLFNRFDIKWIIIFLVTGGYLYGREEKIEGYVDGWNEAQQFLENNTDIDQLLEFDEKEKKNKQENK